MVKFPIIWMILVNLIKGSMVLSNEETKGITAEQTEYVEDEEGYTLGTLTCILFAAKACDASCQTVAEIYGVDSIGTCDKSNFCNCDFQRTSSLDVLWSRKFDPKYVLPQIKSNHRTYGKALEIFQEPFMSTAETAHQLKYILTPYQYTYLRIKHNSPSYTIPRPDGKFNHAPAEKLIADKLQHFIDDHFLEDTDYKNRLFEALKNAKHEETFQHILHEVRHSHNPILSTVVDEYLKSNDEQEAPLPEKFENIIDFVKNVIIDLLIDRIENPKTNPNHTLTPTTAQLNQNTASKLGVPSSNTPLQLPTSTDLQYYIDWLYRMLYNPPQSRWSIPGLTKTLIDSFRGPMDRTWIGLGYRVHYRRDVPPGEIELCWKKGDTEVYLHRFFDNFLLQMWKFGSLSAVIFSEYVRLPAWMPTPAPTNRAINNVNHDAIRRTKQLISSWCEENAFLMGGKLYCDTLS